ncbi:unnamed protein product [Cylicocyclus nassatus]|uniref:Uncharacterized protein n=1 Tax=Cylicocyclus nassatus TaxID=53992 RepID=A0AA36GNE3_CYLNA|nr:unnamed protein product [Cylicocyclus nassatus]
MASWRWVQVFESNYGCGSAFIARLPGRPRALSGAFRVPIDAPPVWAWRRPWVVSRLEEISMKLIILFIFLAIISFQLCLGYSSDDIVMEMMENDVGTHPHEEGENKRAKRYAFSMPILPIFSTSSLRSMARQWLPHRKRYIWRSRKGLHIL